MTSKIKLTADEIRYMALFESITGVTAKDCIIDNHSNKITFITKQNEAGLAVGKNGSKIKLLKKATGRNIEIIEYADNIQDFIKNAFIPAKVKEVRVIEKLDKKKIVVVRSIVNPSDIKPAFASRLISSRLKDTSLTPSTLSANFVS